MKLHAIKEPFNDHQRLLRRFLNGTVNIEKLQGLSEARRQFILRSITFWFSWPTAGIGNNVALRVTDWNGNPLCHHAFGAKTCAKIHNRLQRQTAFAKKVW